ncbi:phosphoribosylglycinamide formyltransferase [Mesonia sp. K7]|uniref:phosphoribosylglycinamide formyltransferase n=1 Tax=Mesonia sp. K7 TaxID=2218606 RepID=UPI000DA9CA10|nr:phosphoribosylglycinamide formyltransferase [Mesonia sp. K7]PZD79061.1 phosphoribosylglycinamide formyltransferase [Mesonia sp. K7]
MESKNKYSPKKIVIFASGTGSNAKKIIEYFADNPNIVVSQVFSNNIKAKVLKTAHELDVQALHFDKAAFYDTNEVLNVLADIKPDLIVLAGFLWLMPNKVLKEFPDKVINLHPALLPKYGGKGMYGNRVHEAVLANNEKETGITFHYVNEKYDEGKIIAQEKVTIEEGETLESLVKKIHALEHKHFVKVIENLLT